MVMGSTQPAASPSTEQYYPYPYTHPYDPASAAEAHEAYLDAPEPAEAPAHTLAVGAESHSFLSNHTPLAAARAALIPDPRLDPIARAAATAVGADVDTPLPLPPLPVASSLAYQPATSAAATDSNVANPNLGPGFKVIREGPSSQEDTSSTPDNPASAFGEGTGT